MARSEMKRRRQELELDQSEIAEATGTSVSTISRIERGLAVADLQLARAIAKKLRTTVDDLWPEKGRSARNRQKATA